MPAGEQVALQPALAGVLGEDLHHPAVPAPGAGRRPRCGLPDLVGDLEHGAEPVGLGLVRADQAEVAVLGVGRHDVAQPAAEHPGRLGQRRAGLGHLDRVGRGSRAAPAARVRRPPLACGFAPIRRSPVGHAGQHLGAAGRRRRRRAPRAGRSASTPPAPPGGPRRRGRPTAAPGAPATCPRPGRRRPPSGRSSPSGCAARSSATVDARSSRSSRAAPLDRGDLGRSTRPAWRPAAGAPVAGSSPSTRYGPVAVPGQQRGQLVVADPGEHGRVGDLVAVEVQDRQHRAVAGRVEELVGVPGGGQRPGLRLAVADDAGRPPGPGLSSAAPYAWDREYPSSPPSWIEPGVSGATWLGMPPGKENWRNSRAMPAASRLTSGYTSL